MQNIDMLTEKKGKEKHRSTDVKQIFNYKSV